ncbi:MAG: MarR family winged helix-turn-helix transcriptional regulator [Rhizomicrobium sp.]
MLKRADYEALAAFRHSLRRFLAFSEDNAKAVGLTPQQHQALLSIKAGYEGRSTINVGELAGHLLIEKHSAAELVDRLEKAGLVKRGKSKIDRRVVMLTVTAKGERLLDALSKDNLSELRMAAPIVTALVKRLPKGK